jgi:hypothetical protein
VSRHHRHGVSRHHRHGVSQHHRRAKCFVVPRGWRSHLRSNIDWERQRADEGRDDLSRRNSPEQTAGANALLEVNLATGDRAFSTPFASSTSQTFTSRATRLSFGATNGNAIDATIENRLDTAAMP